MSEKLKIICSVANAPLLGLTTSDFRRFGQGLKTAGYEGISALPFRVENIVELYQKYFPPIILVEDAWNPGNYDNKGLAILEGIYGSLKRRIYGDKSEPPKIQDTLFFPGKNTSQKITNQLMKTISRPYYGTINFNSRFPSDRTLVHIQSQYKPNHLSIEEVLSLSNETNQYLLFDPTHLLDQQQISYPGQPTQEFKGEWEKQLTDLASRIVGVDIHPKNRQEIEDLMKRTGKLYELTLASQELCDNLQFLRVETLVSLFSQLPLSPFQARGIDYLKQIAAILESLKENKGL